MMQKSWLMAVAAVSLMLLASIPLAAQTATLNLTGVGSGDILGGVYTSPYSGNINGGSTIPVICDDFADDSYVPETWTAYITQLSSILSEGTSTDTTLKWQSGWNGTGSTTAPLELDQAQAYGAAAILAIDILTTTGLTEEEYSYALWELFDPTAASSALSGTGDQSTVQGMVQSAVSEATGGGLSSYLNGYHVTIYSYDSAAGKPTCNGGPCPTSPPQEFITVGMVEPSFTALLGLDVLAVVGLILFFRRRLAGSRLNSTQS